MPQRATESITVSALPETIYRVVTDFEHYADWVTDLKRIDVLTRDDRSVACQVALQCQECFVDGQRRQLPEKSVRKGTAIAFDVMGGE